MQVHVMFDLETLGLTPGSAIVSIGAAAFYPTLDGTAEPSFYQVIDVMSCILAGLTVSSDTAEWWSKQSSAAKAALQGQSTMPLSLALESFSSWLSQFDEPPLWSNGPASDVAWLEAAYRAVGLPVPWRYSQARDLRTIREAAGLTNLSLERQGFVEHNALHDALYQIAVVQHSVRMLGKYGGVHIG